MAIAEAAVEQEAAAKVGHQAAQAARAARQGVVGSSHLLEREARAPERAAEVRAGGAKAGGTWGEEARMGVDGSEEARAAAARAVVAREHRS